MRLKELLHKAGLNQLVDGIVDEEILGLTTDSRAVKPGDLFIGLPGTKVDGGEFWAQAVAQGARALVLSEGIKAESSLPTVHDSDISALCGRLASAFYDFPAQKLALAGVTGTNGKTTTTYLLEHLLNSSGHKSALLGTLVARWPGFSQVAQHTTPFSVDIQKTLAQAVEAGCTHGVMEVSSHALAQKRVYPLTFKTAVFTNLTQDHLDYHPTMEDYFQAKALLFSPEYLQGPGIINRDDLYGQRLLEGSDHISYGLTSEADIYARDLTLAPQGMQGTLVTPQGTALFQAPLVGQFNLYNLLGAVGGALSLGLDLEQIIEGLTNFAGVPGRMERVTSLEDDITVLVDYAHTPDGLKSLLEAARPFIPGRLICVFGCGGDRDRSKRPKMGAITAELADVLVVTSDNPRTEDSQRILDDVMTGISTTKPVLVQVDRRLAIEEAIVQAKPGDGIVIAGKGHEDYQILGTIKYPFDDREESRKALKLRANHSG